jgi:hypothetical protein
LVKNKNIIQFLKKIGEDSITKFTIPLLKIVIEGEVEQEEEEEDDEKNIFIWLE